MTGNKIVINPKGVRWFRTGHPWIFESDVAEAATDQAGIVSVVDLEGKFLAQALYSPASQIAFRILSYKQEEISKEWWATKIKKAMERRKKLSISSNAIRLVFAEADDLPSLIVDAYGDYLVCQTLSAGLEKYKETIFQILKEIYPAKGLLERNDAVVRQKEKLPSIKEVAWGEVPPTTIIDEGECRFTIDLWKGHKTGAYLDQRENRLLAKQWAVGDVCDVFSYQGWFACQMAKGGAKKILCVESSKEAADWIQENAKQNQVDDKISIVIQDGFDFLKEKETTHFDAVNLDPPPFAKRGQEKEGAFRGYKEINLRAMKMLKPEGLLITSSCSHHFSHSQFEMMLEEAAHDSKATWSVRQMRGAALDHPALPTFPEGDYLKCYFVDVSETRHPRQGKNRQKNINKIN